MKIEKIFGCILSACMIVSLLSCNSENEFIGSAQETIPDVEVSTMDMWVKETRSVSEYLNMPVLHFKDEQVYSETLRQLKNMTENERFTHDAYSIQQIHPEKQQTYDWRQSEKNRHNEYLQKTSISYHNCN